MRQLTLRDGHSIPQLGLGTWLLNGRECEDAVAAALRMGYRHIDTAVAYDNHREVGRGIAASGVPRKEIFLTTKLPLGKQKASQVAQLTGQALADLGVSYVDLLLIHWPDRNTDFAETLGAMAEQVKKGKVRSIGVSNFNRQIVVEADEASPIPVVTNQVEFHPYLNQKRLWETCTERKILITAYSPLARGALLDDPILSEVAQHHGVTAAQVSLAWLAAKDIVVIPKAAREDHLKANLAAMDIALSAEEVGNIDGIDRHERQVDGAWKHYPLDMD